ncbi:leucine-rich repeat protein [Metasolibacillus meyeri]|uniref:Leucine-rich repeat protein n=1 Tax=Metasolibacillus meyeri TaxID=1071052 RepID=A0AAW9NX54_9BACL|nr:leucine-rich repeat protein [Metasolibacillus meyeri]MEC1179688.1 leucine-rich repeat protein [Metasolibacillus meyeri]
MIKKWSSIFVIMVLIWSQLGLVSAKAEEIDGFMVTDNPEYYGTWKIIGHASLNIPNLNIPSTLNGKTVTAIGENAFHSKGLQQVVIPSSIQKIDNGAFMYNGITSLTFESGSQLTEIGIAAFNQASMFSATGLGALEIPSRVKLIGTEAFANNRLASLTFEPTANLLSIGNHAFQNNNLGTIEIPASVHTIAESAFNNNQLTSVTFASENSQLKTIGNFAFQNNQLENIIFPSSIIAIGESAFYLNDLKKIEFQQPENLSVTIGEGAFQFQNNMPETYWYLNGNELTPWNQLTVTTALKAYSEPQTLPPAPTNVTAVAGNGEATVSFISTEDSASVVTGDSANVITGYKVKVYVNGQEQSVLQAAGVQSPIIVAGLTNGTTYTFKVVATSGLVDSLDSEVSNAVTPTAPVSKPSAPTIHSVSAIFGAAIVNFYPPLSNGGSAITGYKVKVYEAGIEKPALETTTTNITPTIANTLTMLVPNLTNGQPYTFKVVATNYAGDSEESAESNPPVIPIAPIFPPITPTIPTAPTNVTAVAGNGQASVSFVVPIHIGSPILGYKVKVYEEGVEKPALQATGSMSPITVTGLTNGTEYTFKVVAWNSTGNSADSIESNPVIPNADALTDDQAVTQAELALEVGYTTGDSAAHVTKNLHLPTSGLFETTISWSTNHPLIIKSNGEVIRPSGGDSIVTLIAMITKGNTMKTKTFMLTVKGMSTPTAPNVTPPSSDEGASNNDSVNGTNATTEQLVVDVQDGDGHEVAKTIVNRTTNTDGTVQDRVTLTVQSTTEALAKLQEQNSDTMRIILPTDNRAQQTDIVVPSTVLTMLKEGQVQLEIVAADAKIAIPQSSLQSFEQELYFRVIPVKAADTKQQLEERAKTEQAVQQLTSTTVTLLGQPMTIETNMQNRPVTLTLPLPNNVIQEQLDNLAIYIEHSDGTREVVRGQIVPFKEGVQGIQFEVTKFSTFSILYAPVEKEEIAVEKLTVTPYIQGYVDGTFRPNAPVTRAQMASMLARYLTNDDIPTVQASFQDTTKHGAKDAIEYVKAQGLFQGTTATTFNPNGTITRAQMAAVVVRWIEQQDGELELEVSLPFTDVNPTHWAAEAITKVNTLGIMTGTSATSFNPEGALTRAQAVKVLNQLFEREVQAGTQTPLFTDVTPAHWAFDEIQAAAQ